MSNMYKLAEIIEVKTEGRHHLTLFLFADKGGFHCTYQFLKAGANSPSIVKRNCDSLAECKTFFGKDKRANALFKLAARKEWY